MTSLSKSGLKKLLKTFQVRHVSSLRGTVIGSMPDKSSDKYIVSNSLLNSNSW